jgi:hypothetical protein
MFQQICHRCYVDFNVYLECGLAISDPRGLNCGGRERLRLSDRRAIGP